MAVARPPPLAPAAEAAPASPVLEACLGVWGRHLCCLAGAVGAAEVLAAVCTLSITGLLLLWLPFSLCCCSSVGSLISADVPAAASGSGLPSSGMKGATTCTGLPGDAALPGSSCVVGVFLAATDQLPPALPLKELMEPLLLVGV